MSILKMMAEMAKAAGVECHCMGCRTRKIPFTPESFDALLARRPAALERVFTQADFTSEGNPSAPLTDEIVRRQCFDFDSGLRLILTSEADPAPTLHFDFRVQPHATHLFSEQALQDAADNLAVHFGAVGKPCKLSFTPNGKEYDLYYRLPVPTA